MQLFSSCLQIKQTRNDEEIKVMERTFSQCFVYQLEGRSGHVHVGFQCHHNNANELDFFSFKTVRTLIFFLIFLRVQSAGRMIVKLIHKA